MREQLSFFEQSYLLEFVPAVYWAYNDNTKVYSTKYSINRRGQLRDNSSGRISIGGKIGSGYLQVILRENNKCYPITVHRLVACTFITNKDILKYNQVNHIDENKTNNHILNLEWVTGSENMKALHKKDKNQLKLL